MTHWCDFEWIREKNRDITIILLLSVGVFLRKELWEMCVTAFWLVLESNEHTYRMIFV